MSCKNVDLTTDTMDGCHQSVTVCPFVFAADSGVSNSFPIHATPAQYPGVTGALPLSPSQFHYPADDAQLPTSHAQRSVAQVWPSAEQAQSHIRMAPPTQSMAFDSQRFSMPRHPGFAAHGPQNSTSAFIQDPSRLPSHSTAWGMTDLMQQGSAMLINTTRALQGLAKQDSSMPSGKGSHHVLPFHSHNEGDMTSCVEIIDVTESADDASQPVSAQSDALPFPSVTLPFEVP